VAECYLGRSGEEVAEDWKKFVIVELYDLYYYSPNVIPVVISRRVRWVGHVAYMGKKRNAH
jgi:hypothetical protein